MAATIPMKLRAWSVPSSAETEVLANNDYYISVEIEELPIETLDQLVADWIDAVYASVHKPSPWRNE